MFKMLDCSRSSIETPNPVGLARFSGSVATVSLVLSALIVLIVAAGDRHDSAASLSFLLTLDVIAVTALFWRGVREARIREGGMLYRSGFGQQEAQQESNESHAQSDFKTGPPRGFYKEKDGKRDDGSDHGTCELEDFFENSPAGLQWISEDGVVIRANQAELSILGYEESEYVGHLIAEFYEDPAASEDMLRRLSEGNRLRNYEVRLRAKDGSIKHVLIDANVYRKDNKFVHIRSVSRDITDLKELEAESAERLISEQAARVQAEQSAKLVKRLQTIIDISLMGLSVEQLLQETLSNVCGLLSADAASVLLLGRDTHGVPPRISSGRGKAAEELASPKGQGIAKHVAATRIPVLLGDLSRTEAVGGTLYEQISSLIGAPLMVEGNVIGVIQAASERPGHFKENDLRLLQLVADRVALAIEQTRLYESEQRARLAAESANRIKDEFLATVSHELRSPLNAILGWVQLLRDGNLDERAAARALETVERSARAQARIINDLLDVSRIITGKLRLNICPIDVTRIVDAAVEAVRPAARAKEIELQVDRPDGATIISGDPDRVQQIVWNLISNAIKFTPNRGSVRVSLTRANSHVHIEVSDTGVGIARAFLPYVFDRFRQADGSSTRKQGGLGLGLAIVRHLTELHGGSVEVESAGEGKGATFTVRLPVVCVESRVADESLKEASVYTPVTTISLEGIRVLLVDDDPDARELVEAILSHSRVDVISVGSVNEALSILESDDDWQPDVLISDIEMPDLDGYSLIQRLRKLEENRAGNIPAVALTAYSRVEDRMSALAAGFQIHVSKPVEPAELLTVVASLAGRHRTPPILAS
ncbi:MAG TPA: ATP-binding protein [Blastocatellia bacterium]|nr:ATP-binding protein [Blastocatellia bacterium]